MKSALLLAFCLVFPAFRSGADGVALKQDARSFRLSNDSLIAWIEKSSGRVTSVSLGGRELLGRGSGYWSMSASSGGASVSGFGLSKESFVSIDPETNDGLRAEVACRFRGSGGNGAFPGTSEIRYAVDRNSNTLYATAVMSHTSGDAPFRIGEGRFVMKLDAGIFGQLTVDRDRNWIMPTSRDWEAGTPLNLKEARRMTTGTRAGLVEHKYGYSAMLGNVPAYGWVGNRQPFGVWMINPSVEYIAGGPTKMELTGHLDVGGVALPTLLNMWHGSHYGGTALALERDEEWSKVIGPFAIHFNQGGTSADRLEAAYQQAFKERSAWPYAWVTHKEYPTPDHRCGVSGKLVLAEARKDSSSDAVQWVGLTAPDYESSDRWVRGKIGWQRDGKHYQYWARTRPDGTFSLTGVRPGTYVLRAFADGVLGEFEQAGLTVDAGAVRALGDVHWTPLRAGPTLWEIGIPDRSAAEFRNGDRYWEWGTYLRFKTDFPHGVDYVIGKSDWKKDWNLCQPLNLAPGGKVLGDSTWTVRFPLREVPAGGTRLRVSFCGSRDGSHLAISANGTEIGNLSLPENGTMHRDSHRGMWFERSFDVPANRLRSGENVLRFRLHGQVWHQGVLYDYIRMETVESHEKH